MARRTAEERFKYVAVKRANRAIKALQLLSKCSQKRYYQFSREDVDSIFEKIEKALAGAKASFSTVNFDEVRL